MRVFRYGNGVILVLVALSTGFLFFDPLLVCVQVLLGGTIWVFLGGEKEKRPASSQQRLGVYVLGAFVLIVLVRVYPFLLSSVPLGYDTGIYRYEIWSSFQALPEYVSHLFLGLPLLTDVFGLLGGTHDVMISVGFVVVSLLLPLSLFVFVDRARGRNRACLVLLLFLLSLIQWKAYTMILFKQLFALSLVYLSFDLLRRKSYLVLPVLLFLALLQPLDVFLLGLSVFLYGVWMLFTSQSSKYIFSLLGLGVLLAFLLFFMFPSYWWGMWEVFSQGILGSELVEKSLQSGVFLSLSDYGYQSAFFFVFGFLGFFLEIGERRMRMLSVYFLVLFFWIAFRFFFFQRLLIQFDLLLIIYSAITLYQLYHRFIKDRFGQLLLVFIALGLFFPFAFALLRYEPMIEAEELQRIEEFCQDLPSEAILVATDAVYGPWVRGYCLEQHVIGPGLFENVWSREDWELFWAGNGKEIVRLLLPYRGDMYFYVGERQFPLALDSDLFRCVQDGWWMRRE